ncbi:hypothetical protein N9112_00380 [bacterium]|nr:hypothetical protein [bacterium]
MGKLHRTFYRGKKILVRLKDGKKLVDHYVGKTAKHIILKKNGKILTKQIASTTIYREGDSKWSILT